MLDQYSGMTVSRRDDSASRSYRFSLRNTRAQTIGLFVLLVPGVLIAAAVPITLLLLVLEPGSLWDTLASRPLMAGQLVLACLLAGALIIPALKSFFLQFGRHIEITVTHETDTVHVADRRLAGMRQWAEPLANFRGISAQSSATIGGFQQQLFLVHEEPEKSLLVYSGQSVDAEAFAELTRIFGTGEIARQDFEGSLVDFLSFRSSLEYRDEKTAGEQRAA